MNVVWINHTVSWFKDYLTNRKQRVSLGGKLSKFLLINYGVPQGSILGPILVSLYVNDITSVIRTRKIVIYADDTVLINNNLAELRPDLSRVYKWCCANLLTINAAKTKWMTLGPMRMRSA